MIRLNNEPMKLHTTFRTGGPADCFIKLENAEELKGIIEELKNKNEKYYIIGNGSNLLVSDDGIRGTVIQLGDDFSDIKVEGDTIYACSGILLSLLSKTARDNCLTGLEFASGIPGTLGGAVVMNAGAYGGEMKNVIVSVDAFVDGEIVTIPAEEMDFSYRHSICMEKEMIIIGALMRLSKGNKDEISAEMEELSRKRREKQPIEYPSAGSTFKRPEGYFAGKLIMDSGLAGYSIGGAEVSEKHCGFIINKGGATSDDVFRLIKYVQSEVESKFGVVMEPEVRFMGKFEEK